VERHPDPVEGDIRVFLRPQGGGQARDGGAGFLEAVQRSSYVRLGPITFPQAEQTKYPTRMNFGAVELHFLWFSPPSGPHLLKGGGRISTVLDNFFKTAWIHRKITGDMCLGGGVV